MTNKKMHKIERVKIIVIVLSIILLSAGVIVAKVSYKTYSGIKNIPTLSSDDAKIYKLTENDLYKGEIRKCKDWNDPLYGWCLRSPLFPNMELDIKEVQTGNPRFRTLTDGTRIDVSIESRHILYDPLWKVYWILAQRGYDQGRYYGPFK